MPTSSRTTSTVLLLLALMACDFDTVEEDVVVEVLNSTGVGEAATPRERELLETWASRLLDAEETAVVGRLDSPDTAYVFGEVADILEDDHGNLLVLDGQANNLRVFGQSGEHLHTFGRTGRGPGEFMEPNAMEWWSPDQLVITDRTRRAQVVTYTPGRAPQYDRELATEIAVESACRNGSGLWLHGLDATSEHLVQMLDVYEGGLRGGWGVSLKVVDNAILQMRLDVGHLACASEVDSGFLLTSRYFPYVRFFDQGGNERWHATLGNFHPMRFTMVSRGGRVGLRQGLATEAGGFHWIRSALALDKDTFLVQVGWVSADDAASGSAYTALESILFTAESGVSMSLGSSLPLVHLANDTGLLASRQAPFPQVIRLTRTEHRP